MNGPRNVKELGLESIFVLLTNKCNLACKHCYVSSNPKGAIGLDLAKVKELAHDFHQLNGRSRFVLSGGELFVRDGIIELMPLLSKYHDLFLLTNGTLLNELLAEKLMDLKCAVRIGLDGATPETHDKMRGKGSFNKTIAGLSSFINGGFDSKRIEFFFTVTPNNIFELEKYIVLAERFGIERMLIEPVAVHGRSARFWNKTTPHHDDFRTIFCNEIRALLESGALSSWESNDLKTNFTTLTVYSDGRCFPFTTVDDLDEQVGILGNIHNNSLSEILEPNRYKYISQLKAMRFLRGKGNSIGAQRFFKKGSTPDILYE